MDRKITALNNTVQWCALRRALVSRADRGSAIQVTETIRESRRGARERGSHSKHDNQINSVNDIAFQLPARIMRCQKITNKLCSGEFSNNRELPPYKRAPRKWLRVSRLEHSALKRIIHVFVSMTDLTYNKF